MVLKIKLFLLCIFFVSNYQIYGTELTHRLIASKSNKYLSDDEIITDANLPNIKNNESPLKRTQSYVPNIETQGSQLKRASTENYVPQIKKDESKIQPLSTEEFLSQAKEDFEKLNLNKADTNEQAEEKIYFEIFNFYYFRYKDVIQEYKDLWKTFLLEAKKKGWNLEEDHENTIEKQHLLFSKNTKDFEKSKGETLNVPRIKTFSLTFYFPKRFYVTWLNGNLTKQDRKKNPKLGGHISKKQLMVWPTEMNRLQKRFAYFDDVKEYYQNKYEGNIKFETQIKKQNNLYQCDFSVEGGETVSGALKIQEGNFLTNLFRSK